MVPPPVAPEASSAAAPIDTVVPVMLIAPPPALLLVALTLALSAMVTLWPVTEIVPPFVALACLPADTLSLPVTVTLPPAPPPSTIAPERPETERAESVPETFTTSRMACLTVAALSSIDPPAAVIRPETSTSALRLPVVAAVGAATCMKPSPLMSRVIDSPEPSPTLPSGTLILPAFETVPPSSPTKPPLPTLILPALLTAAELPLPVNVRLPAMKSLSPIASVEATKPPPTSTDPLEVIAMPFGLTR